MLNHRLSHHSILNENIDQRLVVERYLKTVNIVNKTLYVNVFKKGDNVCILVICRNKGLYMCEIYNCS